MLYWNGYHLLFSVLLLFVFGLIVFSTDGKSNSILLTILLVCALYTYLYYIRSGSILLYYNTFTFMSGNHTVSTFLKGFKLVALYRLLKFCCCLFLITFLLFCSCDMLGSHRLIICRVVEILGLNFLPIESSAGL